ncbi:N-acetyl-1-D-myo-inosityl-2-amino-2-deoxy-alpha-D-glucopyranoside deacetylase MshB [Desulfosporosinus sp. I2]|uniref:PIG-L deacetylase family protein n=1 Tax=Desulfosporosinus sp. I2 TaxID=1617025 RepID=UPI0005EEEAF8|nr:PIG-L deacetylase family protein [Desulfosporosinus sp. I2]KJR45032.1 N-acetyl-1-D-myo-inosityl-2-amino-2-deoxy-alpha-D-glucopyranoside deacetylase MshB [Desulfosporosinus sp. I2]
MADQMLLIFAHPDDESFALGGTIAKYAQRGVNITLVVATKGEAGKTADLCQKEELGLFREQELIRAAKVLGIAEVIFLGYLDKEVPIAPPLEIVETLVRIIRKRRPQVVVTFGADGASGHRDHRAIHHFAKAAIKLAKEPVVPEWGTPYTLPRLCYVYPGWRLSEDKRKGLDYIISISPWMEQKWQAILEHRTQVGSRQRFESLEETVKQDYLSREYFECDVELSTFPGRGEDIMGNLERVDPKCSPK